MSSKVIAAACTIATAAGAAAGAAAVERYLLKPATQQAHAAEQETRLTHTAQAAAQAALVDVIASQAGELARCEERATRCDSR